MTARNHKFLNMALAIIVAAGAWVYVVYNVDPMTETTYSEVPVTYTGEDTLADRGLAVSEASSEGVTVVLNQKRTDTGKITSDDISVTADVSGCTAGDNAVTLSVVGPDGTSVMDSDANTIDVTVERAKTETQNIIVDYKNPEAEDTEPIAFDLSVLTAEVTSTSKRLNEIDTVAALLNYNNVGEDVRSYTKQLVALDKDGEVLPHVVIEPVEISLDAMEGYTKEVALNVTVNTGDDENYERTYTVPETIVIKGSEEAISGIGSIDAEAVDLSGTVENGEVPLVCILPEGVYVANDSRGQVLTYTVTEKEKKETTEE